MTLSTQKTFRCPLLVFVLALVCAPGPFAQTSQADAAGPGTFAAVAMPDEFAARASREVLEAGGNAVDAAVAAVFSLAVTFPEAGNIGGGGFMAVYMNGKPAFLDFREKAPLAASRDMYLDKEGNFVQRRSFVGALAVGVPGTVRGMQKAHQRYGALPWKRLLAPAIALAREGFVVHQKLIKPRDKALVTFAEDTNFRQYFGGMEVGQVFRQPELADTLQRIAHDPGDFYRGKISRQIIEQMHTNGGLITARDLSEYSAVWRQPLMFPWRGHEVIASPPPSSGGIALAQLLTMRDAVAEYFNGVAQNSPRYIHLLAEIEKRVFADRGDYLGDPDFGHVPVAKLTDPAYLRRRASDINPEGISLDVKPGLGQSPQPSGTKSPQRSEVESPQPPATKSPQRVLTESPDTTHFSIMDSAGNAVSLTYTQNWEFGSGVVVEGAGFLLNNEMDDFAAKAGVPNAFGVIGGDMNAIEPGKRMLSSMSPTIILRDGKPVTVVGTPGGSTIFTSVFQVILNLYDFDMSAEDAVAATRFHHQLPAATVIRYDEGRDLDAPLRAKLQGMGYTLEPNWWGTIGDVQLVLVNESGQLEAAADPRGRGMAETFPVPAR